MGNCCIRRKKQDSIIHYKIYFYDRPDILNMSYTTINGMLEGEYLLFNKEGKLITKAFYRNDKLADVKTEIYMRR